MRRMVLALAALAVLGLTASDAAAQERRRGIREVHRHRGFWISGGLGGGWENASDAFGTVGRGGSAYIRLGGTPHPKALVGVEILGWGNESGVGDEARANVTLMTMLYPSIQGGWFLKGGFGAAGLETRFGGELEGVGVSLGTGYDFKIGGNFYITPNVDYMVQFLETQTNGSLLFTVGFTVH